MAETDCSRSSPKGVAVGRRRCQIELKLTNIARASLDELLDDYGDYLRVRNHPAWDKDSREALYVRRLGGRREESFETYRRFFEDRPPETLANIAICLIHQANYLLDRQIRRLEKDFVTKGGIRERMSSARRAYRNNNPPPGP